MSVAAEVAQAVGRVPGVDGLTGAWSAATYEPGRRIEGVTLHHDLVEVSIRAGALPLPPIAFAAADAAQEALRRMGDQRPVRIIIEELSDELQALPSTELSDARI